MSITLRFDITARSEEEGKEINDKNIRDGIERGLGDSSIASVSAGIQSALEFYGGKTIAKSVFGKVGKNVIRTIVNDGVKKWAKTSGVNLATAAGRVSITEGFTEFFQTGTSQVSKGSAVGDISKYIDIEEMATAGAKGAITSVAFLGLPGGRGSFTSAAFREGNAAFKKIAALSNEDHKYNHFQNAKIKLQKDLETGQIEQVQFDNQMEAIEDVQNADSKIPKRKV